MKHFNGLLCLQTRNIAVKLHTTKQGTQTDLFFHQSSLPSEQKNILGSGKCHIVFMECFKLVNILCAFNIKNISSTEDCNFSINWSCSPISCVVVNWNFSMQTAISSNSDFHSFERLFHYNLLEWDKWKQSIWIIISRYCYCGSWQIAKSCSP